MRFLDLLGVVQRWWWLLALAGLAAAVTGYTVASQAPPAYEARTRLLVGPFSADLNTQRAAGQLAFTYAELVKSQTVVHGTLEQLGLDMDSKALADSIRASANDYSRILTISLESVDPARAAEIVNTLAANLVSFATESQTSPEGTLQVIDVAEPISTPVAPRPTIVAILAGLAGLLLAASVVLLLEYLDTGVRTEQHLAQLTSLPVLAVVRSPSGWQTVLRVPPVLLDPMSEEGFRIELLSEKLEFASSQNSEARSLALVPIEPHGGGSWIGVNIAAALALRGRRVTLLDVDPRSEASKLVHLGNLPPTRQSEGGRQWKGSQPQWHLPPQLHVVRRPSEELEQLTGSRARAILDELLIDTDMAVVQAPSPQAVPNIITWTKAVDAVVLIVRAGDQASVITALSETLRVIGAPLVGSVLITGRSTTAARWRLPTKRPTDTDPLEP